MTRGAGTAAAGRVLPAALAVVLLAVALAAASVRDAAGVYSDAEPAGGNTFTTAADLVLPYDQTVLADGPVVSYRLGESSGTTATDSSGAGLDGSYVGGPLLGRPGALAGDTAVEFRDGVADHVAVPHHASLDVDDVFSIELWVRRTVLNPTGPRQTMVCKDAGGFCLGFDDDSIQLHREGGGTNITVGLGAPPGITDTTAFHHLVVTKDGGTLNSYWDGQPVQSYSSGLVADMFLSTSGPLYLGAKDGAADSEPFPGLLDEVAVFDYALSAAQVAAHYGAR